MSFGHTRLTIVRRSGAGLNSSNVRRERIGCCHDRGTCPNAIKWIIDRRYYCFQHAEDFWNDGHFVEDHQIMRIDKTFKEEKPMITKHARDRQQMQMSG